MHTRHKGGERREVTFEVHIAFSRRNYTVIINDASRDHVYTY